MSNLINMAHYVDTNIEKFLLRASVRGESVSRKTNQIRRMVQYSNHINEEALEQKEVLNMFENQIKKPTKSLRRSNV
jgi:hypothetical protein